MNTVASVDEGYLPSAQQIRVFRSMATLGRMPRVRVVVDDVGDVSLEQTRAALRHLSLAHEILRTRYRAVPGLSVPLQVIAPDALCVVEDAASGGGALTGPIDPEAGPIVRALRIQEGGRVRIHVALPAVAVDRDAAVQLAHELRSMCLDRGPTADPELQYADYSDWQGTLRESDLGRAAAEFWARSSDATVIDARLPFECPPDPQAGVARVRISHSGLTDAVTRLKGALGASTRETLLTAWIAFSSRLLDNERVVCGIPVDCRTEELRGTLGAFTTRVPLISTVSAESPLAEQLARIHEQMVDVSAYKHCFVEEQSSRLPLGFDFLESTDADAGIHVSTDVPPAERLVLECNEADGELELHLVSPGGMFAAELLATWGRQLASFIAHAASDASGAIRALDVPEPAERKHILDLASGGGVDRPAGIKALHHLIEKQAELSPDAVAVTQNGRSIRYRELNERADRLASRLRAHGAGPDQIVGVYLERSIDMIVAALGILKAGAAYLPLDPEYPRDRLAWMTEDASVRTVIVESRQSVTDAPFASDVALVSMSDADDAGAPIERPPVALHESNLAYVIYTSGSSGRPKGVMISHANAIASTLARHRFYREPVDCFLLLSSFSFDSSVAGIFWTLSQGGRLCLPSPDQFKDAEALARLVVSHEVSHLLALPSFYARILDNLDGGALRCVVVAGEACATDLPRIHYERFPDADLVNEYGPTEGTVWSNAARLSKEDRHQTIPIGGPIGAAQVLLVDEAGELVSLGRTGEMLIGGAGVARGYLNRPALTAERFVADPFSAEPGARGYRTLDVGRARVDGELEFLGRLDSQVKIRGFRVELGEIEARARECAGVEAAAVIVRADGPGGHRQIVAYLSPHDRASARSAETSKQLREQVDRHLRAVLPAFMTPSQYVVLESMPRQPNGKIALSSLPRPDAQDESLYVAPASTAERALVQIWEQTLKLPRVGTQDNFFALGGDSILALLMITKAKQRGLQLSPQLVFEHPTIAQLAVIAEAAPTEDARALRADDTVAVESSISLRLSDADLAAMGIDDRSSIEDVFPMTPMQHGIFLHSAMGAGTGIYHMQDLYRVNSIIDPAALAKAWQHIVRRHPTLRTGFFISEDLGAVQIVCHDTQPACDYLDWRQYSPEVQKERLKELLDSERGRGFELSRPSLMRARLIQMSDSVSYFVRSNHHILMDAWSHGLLLRDLLLTYRAFMEGREPELPQAPAYRSYIEWLQRQDIEQSREFWRNALAGFEHATPLGVATIPDAAGASNDAVEECSVDLTAEETQQLLLLSRELQVTPNTVVQGAWALTLAVHSGQDDVVFGVTTSGRPVDLPDADSIMGLFIQSIPLRARLNRDQRVGDWLKDLLAANSDIRRHEHVSLVDIRKCSDVRVGPLFHSLFVFENAPREAVVREQGGLLDAESAGSRVHTNFPVTVMIVPGAQYRLHISYNSTLLVEEEVKLLLAHFRLALLAMLRDSSAALGDVSLLAGGASAGAPVALEGGESRYSLDEDYVTRFERNAAAYAHRRAAVCGKERWSYAELNASANRIAEALMAGGVRADDLVMVWAPRSLGFLAAVLGAFKARAGYVPVDPRHPPERVRAILYESAPRVILVSEQHEAGLEAAMLDYPCSNRPGVLTIERLLSDRSLVANPARAAHARQRAYVIYTSGSTGKPKGVVVEQQGMLNNQLSKIPTFGLTERDVVAQTASQCFDISVWQFLAPLLCGACVEIVPDDIAHDAEALLKHVTTAGITVLESVPALIRGILLSPDTGMGSLRWIISTGEALPAALARQWFERYPGIPLANAYGPAECSDDVAMHLLTAAPSGRGEFVSLGAPTDNNRLYLLDSALSPVPIGAIGEIHVAGVGVGRGYINDLAASSSSFVPDPFSDRGERLYRTGDLARFRPDGTLEFLGRRDHQVKIRGFRIELGEIEKRLMESPQVLDCAVVAPFRRGTERYLAAFVVLREDARIWEDGGAARLKSHLARTLPDYMIPVHFVRVADLPRNRNGKLDRSALPEPDLAARDRVVIAPRDDIEAGVLAIWRDLLSIEDISVEDHFFELGGHSLLATQVTSRIRRDLGVSIPLRSVFEHPTLERLAMAIRAQDCVKLTPDRVDRLEALLTELEH